MARRETKEQEAFRRQLVYNSVYDKAFSNAQSEVLHQLANVSKREASRLVANQFSVEGHKELVSVLNRHPQATSMQRQVNRAVGFGGANPTPRERAERLASAVSMLYDRQPAGGSSSNS